MRSWVDVPAGSDFPIQNLPYGVFTRGNEWHLGVAIGESILDLNSAARAGFFDAYAFRDTLLQPALNHVLASGKAAWTALRARVSALLEAGNREIADRGLVDFVLVKQANVVMQMPFVVRNYVDFYSSLEHATNMGKILRPGGEALLPNWRYVPIGYHGRAGTVVVDGTPIARPCGQARPSESAPPSYGPTKALDIELETGFVTGGPTPFGTPLPIASAEDTIFGMVLVNDWSARDIQSWEYQPLGPFLGKSFATSISAWVVSLDALAPFRIDGPSQDPPPLEYLRRPRPFTFDIALAVELRTAAMRRAAEIARSNFKYLYWDMAQQLAHAASNGASVEPGDLYASGTISGPVQGSYGSLMELTWRGARPLKLPSGEERRWLEDGDTVTLRGWCERDGAARIGFGSVSGTISPARCSA
ncbi:MAG: fumarylacetoacetase [Candidatus Eremiobacteraeota bacterium]|nr:fumarylacetoacetase [Candidatus Eremiobacteraeota bacterium]